MDFTRKGQKTVVLALYSKVDNACREQQEGWEEHGEAGLALTLQRLGSRSLGVVVQLEQPSSSAPHSCHVQTQCAGED